MSERVKFIGRLLCGERMSDLCREFGISRKTGYKIFDRYRVSGTKAFENQSHRAHRCPHKTPEAIVKLITDLRQTHPSWGAPKIRAHLKRKHTEVTIPAASTIHIILDRHSLIRKRSIRRRFRAEGTILTPGQAPNDLWCADFKGQFRMKNGQYCYPLTITDHWSRFILCVEAFEGARENESILAFENTFKEYGLPSAIRTDNGVPFSSRSIYGLSKLSAWWLRLGIKIQRIEPGNPQQNGTHERMHLTLKQSVSLGDNLLQQQDYFESFIEVFNRERPHDGIEQKTPADLYKASAKQFPIFLPEPTYPKDAKTIVVTKCGSLYLGEGKRVFLSEALGRQPMGVTEIDEGLFNVRFMNYDFGYFDTESLKFTPLETLAETEETNGETNKVSPIVPE
jgi:transposase InsO family protein